MNALASWLAATPLSRFIATTGWVWPTLETLHFLGLCLVFGSLLLVDLRLLGIGSRAPLSAMIAFLPASIAGFAVNAASGALFVIGEPHRYLLNGAFVTKMSLIVLAALNAIYFIRIISPRTIRNGQAPGMDAKAVAALSLVLWSGVIVLGRMIPYFE